MIGNTPEGDVYPVHPLPVEAPLPDLGEPPLEDNLPPVGEDGAESDEEDHVQPLPPNPLFTDHELNFWCCPTCLFFGDVKPPPIVFECLTRHTVWHWFAPRTPGVNAASARSAMAYESAMVPEHGVAGNFGSILWVIA